MQRTRRYMGSFLLSVLTIVPMVSTGCAARVRYYDGDCRDYHRWDAREGRAYHRYWDERHERYRDWKGLNELRDYWKWRHEHPDRD